VLACYLLVDRDRARGALFALVPRHHHVLLARIVVNLETIVGGYVRGQLITSGAMTLFMFVLLSVTKVPNALALAVFGGLADVLPYVGPILTIVPAALAALSRGVGTTIAVVAALAFYEELESRLIIPRVYGRALRLPSWAVILALFVGGSLMGILGALLALPIAAACIMLIEELRVQLPGETALASEVRERDEKVAEVYQDLTREAAPRDAAAVAVEIAEEDLQGSDKTPEGVPAREGKRREKSRPDKWLAKRRARRAIKKAD
jgi:predicted PurR-regulated permease PerM